MILPPEQWSAHGTKPRTRRRVSTPALPLTPARTGPRLPPSQHTHTSHPSHGLPKIAAKRQPKQKTERCHLIDAQWNAQCAASRHGRPPAAARCRNTVANHASS